MLEAGKSPLNEGITATVNCIRCTAKTKHLSCGEGVFLRTYLGGDNLILMIDNFDSFCCNIYQYLKELGEDVEVVRNNSITIKQILKKSPEILLISPGPCSPKEAGISLEAIDYFKDKLPILGVCLGHQAIGEAFGAEIVKADRPIHGHVHAITHDKKGMFKNLPNPLNITRYHSLVISEDSMPDELIISSKTKDGEIMGVRHKHFPIEGVQFHPEAILTEHGHDLFKNFIHNARGVNND